MEPMFINQNQEPTFINQNQEPTYYKPIGAFIVIKARGDIKATKFPIILGERQGDAFLKKPIFCYIL